MRLPACPDETVNVRMRRCALARGAAAWFVAAALGTAVWGAVQRDARPGVVAPTADEASSEKLANLIAQLGHEDYFMRQRAQEELGRLGFAAFDALTEASRHEDLEIASRARYLLKLIRVEWTLDGDPPEVKRQFQNYEYLDAEQRQLRMRALADLPDNKGVPALCRLVRFEQSNVLSKRAALEILGRDQAGKAPKKELVQLVLDHLGTSRRSAAAWLQCWALFGEDPEKALTHWTRLIETEQQLLRLTPAESEPRIVSALLRFRVNWLEKLKHSDEALAAMTQLIDLERGDPETLVELMQWLVGQKAWRLIDEVSAKFAVRFSSNVLLLYALAESYAARGDAAQAEKTAQRAHDLNADGLEPHLRIHAYAALRLWKRGMFPWAQREYESVIARGRPGKYVTIKCQFELAELLHDQADDLKAGQLLKAVADAVGKDKPGDEEVNQLTLAEVRSRMHYFFASHYGSVGDLPQQRKHLDQAIAANSADIDALIACYRLPEATAEYRQKTLDLIRKAADDMRNDIAANPEDSTLYNQYAWLIGNTEGDYDEALRYSKTSLELSPDNGGYYDTLARVYYAKGDYEKAVQTQAKATQFDPHSGQIRRQFEFFQSELERKKKSSP